MTTPTRRFADAGSHRPLVSIQGLLPWVALAAAASGGACTEPPEQKEPEGVAAVTTVAVVRRDV